MKTFSLHRKIFLPGKDLCIRISSKKSFPAVEAGQCQSLFLGAGNNFTLREIVCGFLHKEGELQPKERWLKVARFLD